MAAVTWGHNSVHASTEASCGDTAGLPAHMMTGRRRVWYRKCAELPQEGACLKGMHVQARCLPVRLLRRVPRTALCIPGYARADGADYVRCARRVGQAVEQREACKAHPRHPEATTGGVLRALHAAAAARAHARCGAATSGAATWCAKHPSTCDRKQVARTSCRLSSSRFHNLADAV